MRLLAQYYEARGELVKAQEILLDLFEENALDTQTVKRLFVLFRDMDMEQQAITIMNKYLESNQDDTDAWLELADIYIQKQNFTKALFCLEEQVAHAPRNYLVNLRYAECLYSAARSSDSLGDLQLARKYFSHAAILKEKPCVRALFGLVTCCAQIEKLLAANRKLEDSKNAMVHETAKKQLRQVYAAEATPQLATLAEMPLIQ